MRILIDLTAAPITPANTQIEIMVSAIFHSIGKCPRLLPRSPGKNLIAIPAGTTITH
jgi:hypothetical protein